jgi:hypothetical protein
MGAARWAEVIMDESAEAMWDRLDKEATIEAANTRTFERLYALVKKGYRPDLEETFAGAIWLRHPSKRCKHPRLYLYPSGLVVSPGSSDDFRFYREDEDEARFQKFLRSVPTPTLWDRTRDWRTNVAAWGIILAVCGGSTLFISAVLRLFGFK